MTAGPAGTKVLRLLYFVGAGFICTATINKWRELERKSLQKKQQESDLWTDDNSATTELLTELSVSSRIFQPVIRVSRKNLDIDL
ncbi:hypothetical protein WN943_007170 [Citrus x changshan-huyou]